MVAANRLLFALIFSKVIKELVHWLAWAIGFATLWWWAGRFWIHATRIQNTVRATRFLMHLLAGWAVSLMLLALGSSKVAGPLASFILLCTMVALRFIAEWLIHYSKSKS
jgi:hypothetical protein